MRTKTKPVDRGYGNKTADGVYVKEGDTVWIYHPTRCEFVETKILRFSERCIGITTYVPFFWERSAAVKHRISSLRKSAARATAEADKLESALAAESRQSLDSPPAAE